jgi:diphthine synthase
LRAAQMGVQVRIIHNASILTAIGATGLQLYRYGETVSLPFFTEKWKPYSYYDKVVSNRALGLHTLVLLDIKVKEVSEENLARGREIFEPPRFMTAG